jgi:hypothetical protein
LRKCPNHANDMNTLEIVKSKTVYQEMFCII